MVTDVARLVQAADTYADTFAGQRTAYSFWTGSEWHTAYDRDHHKPLPLTADVVVNAFTTAIPISGYLLAPDNTTHVACLDIDRDDGELLAVMIVQRVKALGGIAYTERSRRGAHAWVILDERRPAILVRRALMALVKEALGARRVCPGSGRPSARNKAGRPCCGACGSSQSGDRAEPHRDPRIELRPASDRLPQGEGKLGHCIRLPTMPHHKTGKRYPLISSEGEKLPGTLAEMMSSIERTPATIFEDLAERAPLPRVVPAQADLRFPSGRSDEDLGTASEILRDLWGVQNAQPGRAVKCPAHDDQRPSLSIARDDQRAFCHSPGCELWNDGRGRGTYELTKMAPREMYRARA